MICKDFCELYIIRTDNASGAGFFHFSVCARERTSSEGEHRYRRVRFQQEVLVKMPCFGPYWSKYVYGDVAEHIAAEKADLANFCYMGLHLLCICANVY